MSIATEGWTSFSGGAGESCAVSTPVINGAQDMDCHGTASVTLTVSGGIGPYSWVTTEGQLSSASGTSTTLTPAANPGSGHAPSTGAYGIATKRIVTFCSCLASTWNCAGDALSTCEAVSSAGCWLLGTGGSCSCSNCGSAADAVCDDTCTPTCSCGKSQCAGGGCPESNAHTFCDFRDAAAIAAGCNPCAISMSGGAVVTVTDSLGQSAFVTILPTPRSTL